MMKVRIINYGYTKPPKRAHPFDAGADVSSLLEIKLKPGETKKIRLGFGLDIPNGFVGYVMPRSSLTVNGITCELCPIDAGYSGEIHIIIHNQSKSDYAISKNDRIGQLVILPVVIVDFIDSLENNRNTKSFGSTGK